VDEFLELVHEPTFALADAAIALVELDRGADLERLNPSIRATPWGEAASAFAQGGYARAALLYGNAGAHVYEAEARLRLALDLARRGAASEAAREAEAAAAFFRRAGAVGRAAESEAAARATA